MDASEGILVRSICVLTGALVLSWLSLAILIALHEAGHGLAAIGAGWRVRGITVGLGPILFWLRLGRFQFRCRAIPLAGSVDITHTHDPGCWPVVWVTLAGPAANLLLAMLVFALVPGSEFSAGKLSAVFLDSGNWIANMFNAVQAPGRRGLYRWMAALSAGSFWIGVFNLLPIWPLDGGEIAALWLRPTRWFMRTSLAVLLCLEVFGWGLILVSR